MAMLRVFTFEHLPREIRDEVYYNLLVADTWFGAHDEDHVCTPFIDDPPHGYYAAILATSKKIHDEAALVLYGKNQFHFEIYGLNHQPFLSNIHSDKCLPKKYIILINYLSVSIKSLDMDILGNVPAFEIVRSNVKQMADILADNHHIAIFKLSFISRYFNPELATLLPISCRGNCAMGEKVLAPLAVLRGVRKVILEDHAKLLKYAQVLKSLMELPPA
ncbi:hypothetical protein MMC15_006054 [Xylographa vitiligo]|nr:hypothetical protein [Xylographa vitiligo]